MQSNAIVIKNSFTNTANVRGSTPANFVKGYTARDDATLTSYPVYQDSTTPVIYPNDPQSLYHTTQQRLKNQADNLDPSSTKTWTTTTHLEGRVFTPETVSASQSHLVTCADAVQQAFDQDHTVLKIVVSFDGDYLRQHNVLTDKEPQDDLPPLMSTVDDMKLRHALRHGFNKLSRVMGYVEPMFIGSVQLDRDHAHAHVVLTEQADARVSQAQRWYDGYEYGRLDRSEKELLKVDVDTQLHLARPHIIVPNLAVCESENLLRQYTERYADVDLRKNLLIAKANPENKVLQTYLFDTVAKTVATKQPALNADDFKKTLQENLDQEESTTPLPDILDMQMQSIPALKKKDTPMSKTMARIKLANQQQIVAKERQTTAQNEWLYLSTLRFHLNHQERELLDRDVLPYYRQQVVSQSYNVDQARIQVFNRVEEPRKTDLEEIIDLREQQQAAVTALDTVRVKDQVHHELLRWHHQGNITANDIAQVVNADEDKIVIPTLKPSGIFDKDYRKILRQIDPEKQHAFERPLFQQAYDGLEPFRDDPRFDTLIGRMDYRMERLDQPQMSAFDMNQDIDELIQHNSIAYDQTKDLLQHTIQDTLVQPNTSATLSDAHELAKRATELDNELN